MASSESEEGAETFRNDGRSIDQHLWAHVCAGTSHREVIPRIDGVEDLQLQLYWRRVLPFAALVIKLKTSAKDDLCLPIRLDLRRSGCQRDGVKDSEQLMPRLRH